MYIDVCSFILLRRYHRYTQVCSYIHFEQKAEPTVRWKFLRNQFISLALLLGGNDFFNQVRNPPGSMLRKIHDKIQSMVAFSPVLFYGRGIFQYTFYMIPHRRPVHVVGM